MCQRTSQQRRPFITATCRASDSEFLPFQRPTLRRFVRFTFHAPGSFFIVIPTPEGGALFSTTLAHSGRGRLTELVDGRTHDGWMDPKASRATRTNANFTPPLAFSVLQRQRGIHQQHREGRKSYRERKVNRERRESHSKKSWSYGGRPGSFSRQFLVVNPPAVLCTNLSLLSCFVLWILLT